MQIFKTVFKKICIKTLSTLFSDHSTFHFFFICVKSNEREMSGDAGNPHLHQHQNAGGLPEINYSRADILINYLTNSRFDLRHRRFAAEELRILMTHRYCSPQYQEKITDVFVKVLKKSKEDQTIVEQILWNVTNLSCENVPMLHVMLQKVSFFRGYIIGRG